MQIVLWPKDHLRARKKNIEKLTKAKDFLTFFRCKSNGEREKKKKK